MEKPNPLYSWARRAARPVRWVAGVALIIAGLFGFLPVLGFWMIPLGILLLASDHPRVREAAMGAIRWLGGRLGWNGGNAGGDGRGSGPGRAGSSR